MKYEPTRLPSSPEDICPALIGAELPKLTLAAEDSSALDLNAVTALKPTILIFYRGGWCPYCDLHFSQIHQIEGQLEKLGYQLIAISPDRPESLVQTADKHQFNVALLSDSKVIAATALGIAFRMDDAGIERYKGLGMDLEGASGETHHLLPVPAVYVLSTDGVIQFEYINPNHKVRLDPDVLVAAAIAALKTQT